jgi:hypothetical protein
LAANNDRPALSWLSAHRKGAGKPAQRLLMGWIPAFAGMTDLVRITVTSLFQQRQHGRVGLVGQHQLEGKDTLVETVIEKGN